jgi:DNA-binding NtrC family response regulator
VAIPVIVMSGYSTRDTVREAEALGAAAFLSKPFTPDELAEIVRRVLKTITSGDEKEKRHGSQEDTGDR